MQMDRVEFLKVFKAFTEETMADLILPTRVQKASEEQEYRVPEVYLMRLPDSKSATKKAPYILHQLITGTDVQEQGTDVASSIVVRSIFCAYSADEQEGALMLLNMAERLRIALLRRCAVGDRNQFALDLSQKIEFLAYPDDTAPYYAGEMITTWWMPPVSREMTYVWHENQTLRSVPTSGLRFGV